MADNDELYQCVGVCMPDPDSGYCLGCGRPPFGEPGIVAEAVEPTHEIIVPTADDSDTPE